MAGGPRAVGSRRNLIDRFTTPHGSTLRDGGRLLATCTAIFSIAAGIIHVSAAADHTNLPVMMVGFLVVATLQVGFGGLLLWRRPNRLLLLGAFTMMTASIGLWLLSRTAGLPLLPGGHMEPIGFKDGITVVFELATMPGVLLLMSREVAGIELPSHRLGTQTVSVLSSLAFVLTIPALMLGGGAHHSHDEMEALGGHSHGDETASAGHDGAANGHGHGSSATGAKTHEHDSDAGHDHGRSTRRASTGDRGHGHGSGMSGHGATDTGNTALADSHGVNGHGDDSAQHGNGPGAAPRSGSSARSGSGSTDHGHGSGHGQGSGGSKDAPAEHASAEQASHDEPHASGDHAGDGDEPNGVAVESASAGEDGKPGRGSAVVWRGDPSESEGPGHSHDAGPCRPTPDQQAAADKLYRETEAALRRYENAPWRALADGFYYAFGPTDRIMHMVNPGRRSDPTILDAGQIESFLYAMTDRGWVAIGGMYIMPEYGMTGPEIGGCLTKWHYHGGLGGRIASAGTMERTPEMLHVWTYPGLDPWGHYDGRELSQLWTFGKHVPSVCRKSGDSSDVCLP